MAIKLQGSEFTELFKALHASFNPNDFDDMLTFLDRPRQDIIATGAGGFPSIVTTVMVAANQAGWMGDLIVAANDFYPIYRVPPTPPAITAFLANHPRLDPVKVPADPDPYESLVMRGGRVFIGRDDLRQKLRVIGTQNFSRVLVVNGAKRSGKTYSSDFLHHVQERMGLANERVVYVDVDTEVNRPEDLLSAIGRPLGLGKVPERTSEQDARTWVPSAGNWVRDGVQKKKTQDGIDTWWFVFDGFADKTHESTTYDLILQLATRADKDMAELRLLLLNYGQRLGTQHLFVNEEEIPEIGEKEVFTFLKRAGEKANVFPVGAIGAFEDVVEKITRGEPSTQERLCYESTKETFEQVTAKMKLDKAPPQELLCYVSRDVTLTARRLFPGWMP